MGPIFNSPHKSTMKFIPTPKRRGLSSLQLEDGRKLPPIVVKKFASYFSCPICRMKFVQKSSFVWHMRIHGDGNLKPFNRSPSPVQLQLPPQKQQQLEVTPPTSTGPPKLPQQGNGFGREGAKNRVVFIHKKSFNCKICDYSTMSLVNFDTHLSTHGTLRPKLTNTNSPPSPLPANEIQKDTAGEKSSPSVPSDTTTTPPLPPPVQYHQCYLCDFRAKDTSQLKCHMVRHLGIGSKYLKCGFCNFSCLTSGQLVIHSRNHRRDRPFKCGGCHFETEYPASFLEHCKNCSGMSRGVVEANKTRILLQKVMTNGDNKGSKRVDDEGMGGGLVKCTLGNCDYRGENEKQLISHNLRVHKIPMVSIVRINMGASKTKGASKIKGAGSKKDTSKIKGANKIENKDEIKSKCPLKMSKIGRQLKGSNKKKGGMTRKKIRVLMPRSVKGKGIEEKGVFKCQAASCKFSTRIQKELNDHYVKGHGVPTIFLTKVGGPFNTRRATAICRALKKK